MNEKLKDSVERSVVFLQKIAAIRDYCHERMAKGAKSITYEDIKNVSSVTIIPNDYALCLYWSGDKGKTCHFTIMRESFSQLGSFIRCSERARLLKCGIPCGLAVDIFNQCCLHAQSHLDETKEGLD